MLDIMIDFFRGLGWKVPCFFQYMSTRALGACFTSLLLGLVLGPYFIRLMRYFQLGQFIRKEDCPPLGKLHQSKEGTPTMGGILIFLCTWSSVIIFSSFHGKEGWMSALLLITSFLFVLLGFIDDGLKIKHANSKGLRAKYKFFAQIIISLITVMGLIGISAKEGFSLNHQDFGCLGEYYFPFIKTPFLLPSTWMALFFIYIFTTLVVVGSSNAVNLADGLDGMAGGLLVVAIAPLLVLAYLSMQLPLTQYLNLMYIPYAGSIVIFLAALAGALLAFLWFNGHPAELFMGDVGSLALGGILGICAVAIRRECFFAIISGVFVLEALSVIIQVISFKLYGKRVFRCAPIHHHFEYLGWPESKVVLRFWILGLLCSLIGLISIKLQ